jgi:hypothetical protein
MQMKVHLRITIPALSDDSWMPFIRDRIYALELPVGIPYYWQWPIHTDGWV